MVNLLAGLSQRG